MGRKKEQKCFVQYMPNLSKHYKNKFFINVYNAAHETLKLLGQGGYRSSSTACFIHCLNITFMRVFKELMKNMDKK